MDLGKEGCVELKLLYPLHIAIFTIEPQKNRKIGVAKYGLFNVLEYVEFDESNKSRHKCRFFKQTLSKILDQPLSKIIVCFSDLFTK